MRGKSAVLYALFLCSAPSTGWAQDSPASTPSTAPNSEAATPLGGKPSIDAIRIDSPSPNVPLRHDGVVRGSEDLDLDGRKLVRGKDYTIDYGTGVVILATPTKVGQVLRANYRYDPALAKSTTEGGNNWSTMKFNFSGGNSMSMGLGMVERGADGTLTRSDLYALKNNFGAGNGGPKLKGVMAFGNQQSIRSESAFGKEQATEKGTKRGAAIVQELATQFGGGSVVIGYQSIDKNFTGISALRDSGYSDQAVNAMAKERGLKRIGLSMNNVKIGGLSVNQNFQTVSNGGASIKNNVLDLGGKGWRLNYNGRSVDKNFGRFRDLADGDREQLMKEAGLDTTTVGLNFDNKGSKLSLNSHEVTNNAGNGFVRQSVRYESKTWSMSYGTQSVDKQFNQFQGIRLADAGQIAREQGINRRNFALGFNSPTATGLKFAFSQSAMSNGDKGLEATSVDVSQNGLNYTYREFGSEAGFDGLGRMSQAEQDANISSIALMYQPSGVNVRPEDRAWFTRGAGLNREMHRIQFSAGKSVGVTASILNLTGRNDSGNVSSVNFDWKNSSFSYRHQSIGANLTEIGNTMSFERERLGTLTDLNKTDIRFSTKFGDKRSLDVDSMDARHGNDTAKRRILKWADPNLQLMYAERGVSSAAFNMGQLVDPERDLLGQIAGQEQRQLLVNWLMMRDLRVQLNFTSGFNDLLNESRNFSESLIDWSPDKTTKLQWYSSSNRSADPTMSLFDHDINRFLISKEFQNGGFEYERETHEYSGENDTNPSSVRNSFSVETKISENTSVRTEQSQTSYNNGDRDRVSAHTVSTGITKDAGVSVTDVNINRSGARPDERRRNYGFWLNLGNGVKFTYGYARELGTEGKMNSSIGLSGGTIGGLSFGGANYNTQRWDGSRNKSLGNFQLGSTKPMQMGFVRDFSFNLATDTVRDMNAWQRENRTANFGMRVGDLQLGFDYASQIHQNGHRAVDRAFRFKSDQSPKRKFVFDAMLKFRTMPWDQEYAIRNVTLTGRFLPGFDVSHSIQTNPEVARGDALLGSTVQPLRVLSWKIQQTKPDLNTRFGASWEERINEQTHTMSRLASINMTLYANSPSPLNLFYGLEQVDINNQRKSIHRYGIDFSQRPGPNQMFSLSFGNVSWQHGRDDNTRRENWTARLNYQLRF